MLAVLNCMVKWSSKMALKTFLIREKTNISVKVFLTNEEYFT